MEDLKTPNNVMRMLRQLIQANTPDPLPESSRGTNLFTQYFAGTGIAGQINYLDRVPSSDSVFVVEVNGVQKTLNTDFTLDTTNNLITWTSYTPPVGTTSLYDNIKVIYTSIMPWVYDDTPNQNLGSFPRITVEDIGSDYETFAMGTYTNYNSGPGNKINLMFKAIVRNRKNNKAYLYQGYYYQNMDVVYKIGENIVNYFQTHRKFNPWKFWDWEVVRVERNRSEEPDGVFRLDITLKAYYFDKS